MKTLLENPVTDINCKDDNGRTLISVAIDNLSHQSLENIKFLLSKKADVNLPDLKGWTPLHFAANYELQLLIIIIFYLNYE